MFTIKRILSALALSLFLINGCGGPEPEPAPGPTPVTPAKISVSGVSLNKSSITLVEGANESLVSTVSPSNATDKEVTWSSSESSVASVDSKGTVTAVKAGTTTITVKTNDGGKTASCSVTVEAKVIPVASVSIDQNSLELIEGEEATLVSTVEPGDATNKTIAWSSSDPSVATVEDGKVVAVAPGTATITVTTEDGEKTASCEVTVASKEIRLEKMEMDPEAITIRAFWSETIAVLFYPDNVEDKNVTWISTDESVAWPKPRPDQPDVCDVQSAEPGEAYIIAISPDGEKTAQCKVTVSPVPLERVSVQMSSMLVYVGQEIKWDVYYQPSIATNKNVTWSVADPSIASVDQNGVIKGLSPGNTKVSIVSEDGGLTSEHELLVQEAKVKVTSIELDKKALSMTVGTEEALSAILTPSNATNKVVDWWSSDVSVAWVTNQGIVSAKGPGKCTIFAVTSDGRLEAGCEVTVVASPSSKVSGVRISNSEINLNVGGVAYLYAVISPSTATNRGLTWTSSDPSVVKVDNSGKVTAGKVGNAVITVKTADGGFTDKCTVTVQTQVVLSKALSLDRESVTLNRNSKIQLKATITPSNVTNPNVSWRSDNESVAKVDSRGVVTAVGPGTARVTAFTEDNGTAAICRVTVRNSVNGISINGPGSVSVYSSIHLEAVVTPSDASEKSVTWSSSNTAIATVDQLGNVKGLKEGRVTITAAAKDGAGAVGSVQISVTKAVTTYLMLADSYIDTGRDLEMLVGEYRSFGVIPYPREHKPEVTWTCSNDEIIEIRDYMNQQYSRLLYAKKAGTCIITLKAMDGGGATRSFKVVVKQQ